MTAGDIAGTLNFTTGAQSSAWQNWFQGGPIDGFYIRGVYSNLLGNVNAIMRVEGKQSDGSVVLIASDPRGPANVATERTVRASMGFDSLPSGVAPVQFRVTVIPNELPDGTGSKNSSSLSSQTFNSSSSGGSQAGTLYWYLAPASNG